MMNNKNKTFNRKIRRMIKRLASHGINRSDLKSGLVFAGFGAMIYLINRMIPKLADDYAFSFVWDGDSNGNLAYGKHHYKRVRTMKDLAISQLSHYKTWSGRTIGETLNQLVQMKDDKVFYDRINTGVVLVQLFLCLWAGRGKVSLKKISPVLALMLTCGYWFSTPHLVMTSLWMTGATNYSWPGLIQSAFLLPYGLHYHDRNLSLPAAVTALSGLLAGWSNEAGGGIALLMSAAACVRAKMLGTGKRWMLAGLLGTAVGYGLLMLAPGNFRRIIIEREHSDILDEEFSGPSTVSQDYLYTPTMILHYLKNSFSSVILRELPLDIPVVLYFARKKNRSIEDSAYILAMEAAAWGVPVLLLLSPQFPKRAAYPGIIYRMTAAVKAMEQLDISFPGGYAKLKTPLICAAVTAGAGLFVNVIASMFSDADLYIQTQEQNRILREHTGDGIVYVPDVLLSPFWTRLAGDRSLDEQIRKISRFEEHEGDPYNMAVAAYYGVDGIRVYIPDDHPYNKNGLQAIKEQILRPPRCFIIRLKELFSITDERN